MKRVKTWLFGILFLSVIAFTGWKIFVNSFLYMGETKKVHGKIIEVFPSREVKTYNRRIKYIYCVNNEFFLDFKKLGTQDVKQEIGNRVQIAYSINNPQNNRVEKLFSDHKNSLADKYYSIKGKGYIELQFINGIFKYKEFAQGSDLVHDIVGEYLIKNDTLHFQYYKFKTDSMMINAPETFVFGSKGVNQIIEINTSRIFKKI